MYSLRIAALALLLPIALQAQTSWWQRVVVLPPDSSVAIDVREAIDYKLVSPSALRMDVYRPHSPSGPLPGVIFVHGGPIPSSLPVEPRQIGQYTSLGRLVASHGLVGVVFSHRLTSAGAIDTAASDVRDAVQYVVDNADSLGIDQSRLCIWSISAGSAVLGPAFQQFAGRIRCFVSHRKDSCAGARATRRETAAVGGEVFKNDGVRRSVTTKDGRGPSNPDRLTAYCLLRTVSLLTLPPQIQLGT